MTDRQSLNESKIREEAEVIEREREAGAGSKMNWY